MDGISPSPQPPQQKTNIFLVSVVIGVLLLFLLLVLNYFNSLPLSQLFPNQLSFLPHRQQDNKPIPQPTQIPINYSSNAFQYDSEKTKTILSKYIKDTLKPELIPQTLEVKQGLSIDNRIEDIKYQFGAYVARNQESISVNFHYKENTNTPNDFIIFIQPSKVEQTTLNSTLANSLVSSYFINPYSPIVNCNTKGTTSYCEIFKIENDGKRGFGALIEQDKSIVFTCFIPKDSKDYDNQRSCISL